MSTLQFMPHRGGGGGGGLHRSNRHQETYWSIARVSAELHTTNYQLLVRKQLENDTMSLKRIGTWKFHSAE